MLTNEIKTEQDCKHRVAPKQSPQYSQPKTDFRRIVKELMLKASEKMEEPSPRMKMYPRILHEQYGLLWFGGIMTFEHLGLGVAARDGATPFMWGKEQYPLTGYKDKLDKFVEGCLKCSADHLRPQIGCDL